VVGQNLGKTITDGDAAELKALIGTMPAYADVAPALGKLRRLGLRWLH
jgi:2-haloacid dehalogenase